MSADSPFDAAANDAVPASSQVNWRRYRLLPWDAAVMLGVPLLAGRLTNGVFEPGWVAQAPLTAATVVACLLMLREAGLYRTHCNYENVNDTVRLLLVTLAVAALAALVDSAVPAPSEQAATQALFTVLAAAPLLSLPRLFFGNTGTGR